jgi:signal transduction histidine kinase
MGLSICRTLVEAHGGTIALAEKTGTGALFRVTLPAAD